MLIKKKKEKKENMKITVVEIDINSDELAQLSNTQASCTGKNLGEDFNDYLLKKISAIEERNEKNV